MTNSSTEAANHAVRTSNTNISVNKILSNDSNQEISEYNDNNEKENGTNLRSESLSLSNGKPTFGPQISVDFDENAPKLAKVTHNEEELTELDNNSYMGESIDDQNILDFQSQSCLSMSEYPDGIRHETIVDHLPLPPDGGYGWVIVGAAFVSNFLVDGVANSFGAFFGAYQETFHASKAATSFIGSLLIGSYLLSGPVAGGLLNRYEARKVVLGGTFLTSIAFVLSTFSPNIFVHYIFYGFFGGIGFGFIYLPAIVCVSQYFESKRALATGLAVSGSGLGTFAMPLLCKYLIDGFGWKITIYCLAFMIILCAICAFFYRPLPLPEEQLKLNEELKQQALLAALSRAEGENSGDAQSCASGDLFDEDGGATTAGGGSTPFKRPRTGTVRTNSECTNHAAEPTNEQRLGVEETSSPVSTPLRPPLSPINEGKPPSLGVLSKNRAGSHHVAHHANPDGSIIGSVTGGSKFPGRTRKATLTSLNSEFTSIAGGMDFRRPNSNTQLSRVSARSYAHSLSRIGQAPNSIRGGESVLSVALSSVDPKEFTRPLSRRDIFLQGSIRNLKEFSDEGSNYKAYRESQVSIPLTVVAHNLARISQSGTNLAAGDNMADLSSRMGDSRYSKITGAGLTFEEDVELLDESKYFKWVPLSIRSAFHEMIDLNLLKEPIMILICISNILGMIGFYVPFVFLIDLAIAKNCSVSEATFLLSIIGITNTFGRVFFGWMADHQWLTALLINNLSLILCGIMTFFCPLLPNYLWLSIYAAFFGFIVSAYICLTSIVLSDLLGVERLTNSFGLLVVSRGIASLLGTPLAGIVYDMTMSYDFSFYFAGVLILLSGLVSCIIPALHRYERSKLKNEGDYPLMKEEVEAETQSGKLSVLTERSEENLTEYQRTIQSIYQQRQLIRELEEYKKRSKVEEINEENPDDNEPKPLTINAT